MFSCNLSNFRYFMKKNFKIRSEGHPQPNKFSMESFHEYSSCLSIIPFWFLISFVKNWEVRVYLLQLLTAMLVGIHFSVPRLLARKFFFFLFTFYMWQYFKSFIPKITKTSEFGHTSEPGTWGKWPYLFNHVMSCYHWN